MFAINAVNAPAAIAAMISFGQVRLIPPKSFFPSELKNRFIAASSLIFY